jgi:hypothetical protein
LTLTACTTTTPARQPDQTNSQLVKSDRNPSSCHSAVSHLANSRALLGMQRPRHLGNEPPARPLGLRDEFQKGQPRAAILRSADDADQASCRACVCAASAVPQLRGPAEPSSGQYRGASRSLFFRTPSTRCMWRISAHCDTLITSWTSRWWPSKRSLPTVSIPLREGLLQGVPFQPATGSLFSMPFPCGAQSDSRGSL